VALCFRPQKHEQRQIGKGTEQDRATQGGGARNGQAPPCAEHPSSCQAHLTERARQSKGLNARSLPRLGSGRCLKCGAAGIQGCAQSSEEPKSARPNDRKGNRGHRVGRRGSPRATKLPTNSPQPYDQARPSPSWECGLAVYGLGPLPGGIHLGAPRALEVPAEFGTQAPAPRSLQLTKPPPPSTGRDQLGNASDVSAIEWQTKQTRQEQARAKASSTP